MLVLAGAAVVGAVAVWLRHAPAPVGREHAAPARPSLHAAPPGDVSAASGGAARSIPESLRSRLPTSSRPTVLVFLGATCECSKGFARTLAGITPFLGPRASVLAVVEGDQSDAERFIRDTSLGCPHVAESDAGLAAALGVTKAGAFALVEPDGSVHTVWPGISRHGFRELATRLGDGGIFPADALEPLPGTATAGCVIRSVSVTVPQSAGDSP